MKKHWFNHLGFNEFLQKYITILAIFVLIMAVTDVIHAPHHIHWQERGHDLLLMVITVPIIEVVVRLFRWFRKAGQHQNNV